MAIKTRPIKQRFIGRNKMNDADIDNTVDRLCLNSRLTIVLEMIAFLEDKKNKLDQELNELKEKKDA